MKKHIDAFSDKNITVKNPQSNEQNDDENDDDGKISILDINITFHKDM